MLSSPVHTRIVRLLVISACSHCMGRSFVPLQSATNADTPCGPSVRLESRNTTGHNRGQGVQAGAQRAEYLEREADGIEEEFWDKSERESESNLADGRDGWGGLLAALGREYRYASMSVRSGASKMHEALVFHVSRYTSFVHTYVQLATIDIQGNLKHLSHGESSFQSNLNTRG